MGLRAAVKHETGIWRWSHARRRSSRTGSAEHHLPELRRHDGLRLHQLPFVGARPAETDSLGEVL